MLGLVAHGLTSREIAERLAIGCATVETHVRLAMEKVDARTRLQAVLLTDAAQEATDSLPLDPEVTRLARLLADGMSVSAAARALGLSRRTADRRLAALRQAVGARTTIEAVLLASRRQSRG